jgi:hypothetical protein
MAHIEDSEFNVIPDTNIREMLVNAYKAVNATDSWEWLRGFNEQSFTFSRCEKIGIISSKMEELGYHGHSGTSFGITMRQMELIAKHGKDQFFNQFKPIS